MMHNINVSSIARDALLLSKDDHAEGHYPIWFYDPSIYSNIQVGDFVTFSNNGETYAHGIISEINILRPTTKVCSEINFHAFKWTRKFENEAGIASG